MNSGNVHSESRTYRIETQQRYVTSNQRSTSGTDHAVTSNQFNGSSITNVPSIRVTNDTKPTPQHFRPVSPLGSKYKSRAHNDNEANTAVIKSSDMTEEMQETAVEIAVEAFERCKIEKDIAANIKRAFDDRLGPTWHCIVGKSFGSYVTHETDYSIYMYIGQMAVLLFKQG